MRASWHVFSSPPPCRTSMASSTWAIWPARCCRRTCTPASAACKARRCCSYAPPTSMAPPPSLPPRTPARRARLLRCAYIVQRDACAGLSSFDHFGRSSNQPNHDWTQHSARCWKERHDRGAHVETGLFDRRQRFLPDRYVEGTCPNCGFDARGDQCDNCQTLLDPVQLINPRSKISGSTNVELRDTAHLFLKQPLMQDRIRAWVDKSTEWPQLRARSRTNGLMGPH